MRSHLSAALLLLVTACRTTTLEFDERDALAGHDMLAKLRYVSQLDQLDDTTADHARCSTAATLNAYLLLGGEFAPIAQRFGVGTQLTYANVHRLQEAIYHYANVDGSPGILGASHAEYGEGGRLVGWRRHEHDEYQAVLDAFGLHMDRIYAPSKADTRDKRAAVQAWLDDTTPVVFVVGVDEDMERERFVPMDQRGNHYVILFRWNDRFYALDSYRTPGNEALVALDAQQVEDNLFYTPNALFVVHR